MPSYVVTCIFPECGDGFFFTGGSCQPCPGNSTSSGGTGGSCTCRMNYTILNGESTTSGEDCVCRENYHINSNQCVSCPANSFRAITPLHISMCMCDSKRSTTDGNTTTSGSVPCDGESSYH